MWLLIFDRQVHFHYEMEAYVEALNIAWLPGGENGVDFDRHFIVGYPYFLSSESGEWSAERFRNEG